LFQKISGKPTFTATNNCNQVFADASRQLYNINLPPFRGLTLLTIASNYPHKNLGIIARVAEALARRGIRDVRFVVTVTEAELPVAREASSLVHHLGAVKIEQCPGLYRQADVMFLPTLLECFSASYAEAMQMQVPILTSDEPFAHGLCGDAAMYCNTLSVDSVIAAIESLRAWTMRRDLAVHGIERLKTFDTAEQRADKYIKIIESCYKTLNK
jgi:glycosyltransferase involved in cell wall biosynthesis